MKIQGKDTGFVKDMKLKICVYVIYEKINSVDDRQKGSSNIDGNIDAIIKA